MEKGHLLRAWDHRNKEYIHFDRPFTFEEALFGKTTRDYIDDISFELSMGCVDKNGKHIFENDIALLFGLEILMEIF